MKLNEAQIKQLSNDMLGAEYWTMQLGIEYFYQNIDRSKMAFSAPYFGIGTNVWEKVKGNVYNKICSKDTPQDWVKEILAGDVRNLGIAMVTSLTGVLSFPVAIIIPIVGILLKTQIASFCSDNYKPLYSDDELANLVKEKKLVDTNSKEVLNAEKNLHRGSIKKKTTIRKSKKQ